MAEKIFDYGTGRRKSSVSRAFLTKGSGKIIVNGKKIEDYFPAGTDWFFKAVSPLMVLSLAGKFNVKATVKGGGITGQSGALCLAIARALVNCELRTLGMTAVEAREKNLSMRGEGEVEAGQDPAQSTVTPWHDALRVAGLLTRDPRVVERKLVGFRKSRKKPQFSKR